MGAVIQNWVKKYIWDTEEQRAVNLENPNVPIGGWQLDQILGGNSTASGQSISFDSSLTLSAVWRAAQIRSGFVSSLPFKVYRRTDNGRQEVKPSEHPVAAMFARKPNPRQTKVVFLDRAMTHFDFWGNHYGLIKTNGIGRAYQIDLVHPKYVKVYTTEDGSLAYKVKDKTIPSSDIIHVPNLGDEDVGKSVIQYAREDIGLQFDTRGYGTKFYSKGGRVEGILEPAGRVSDPDRQKVQDVWTAMKKRGGDIALPNGWTYKAIGIPPDDAAYLASNEFGISTVARWFGVPINKLGDLSQATYSNIEHLAIEFIQDTMSPIISKIEAEYTTKLFTLPGEQDLYLEFNVDAYLRADSMSKAQLFSTYVQNGIKKPNEIRKLNNDPDDPYGDDLMMQSGTMPLRLMEEQMKQKQSAPAAKRNKRYSLPEIQKILRAKYHMTDEQLDMFHVNGNGNGKH